MAFGSWIKKLFNKNKEPPKKFDPREWVEHEAGMGRRQFIEEGFLNNNPTRIEKFNP